MGLLHPLRGYGAEAKAAVDEAMEQAGITDLAARSWRALSGGQRRRALAARALAAKPELLVLDEPTANMDAESETRLFETLGKLTGTIGAYAATILIVTHDMDFVSALTGRVLCMGDDEHQHRIVQHRTEAAAGIHRRDSTPQEAGARFARVIHGENISSDSCCE
jgi:zinc transport system ATP-binding protein